MVYKIDLAVLREQAIRSKTFTDLVVALGYTKHNTYARKYIRKLCEENDISFDKYIPETFGEAKQLSELLVVGESRLSGSALQKRLLKAGLLENKCMMPGCNVAGRWNNKTLKLHLDHLNGNSLDSRLENLRLLCPNCHSQTDTYTGRNNKLGLKDTSCLRCGELSKSGTFCSACIEPAREEGLLPETDSSIDLHDFQELSSLEAIIEELGISGTARKYGVDKSTVRNYLRRLQNGQSLPKKQRRYPKSEKLLQEIDEIGIEGVAKKYATTSYLIRAALWNRKNYEENKFVG